jgi:hypothetical protein
LVAYLGLFLWRQAALREVNRAQDRGEEVARRLGGTVQRYNQGLFKPWAETVVGFGTVAIGDDDLAFLDGFPIDRLGGLSLASDRVTDAGLARIGRMARLSILNLGPRPDGPGSIAGRGARITDAGLVALRPLRRVLMLGLGGTPITDAGLENLRGVGSEYGGQLALSLAGTAITDAGLARLPELFPGIHWLELDGCAVTDEGLRHLGRLRNLSHLSLSGTRVGDEGLRHLVGLPQLNRLYLERTLITDAGLAHLKSMGDQYQRRQVGRATPGTAYAANPLIGPCLPM